jgi:hypothetical protein
MRLTRRLPLTLALAALLSTLGAASASAPALASGSQIALIQDGNLLVKDPGGTMLTFRKLGAGMVRVIIQWAQVAPRASSTHRPSFNASDPGAYPAANWAIWDEIVRDAKAEGIAVDVVVSGGAPRWAEGGNPPGGWNVHFAWKPSAGQFGQFVHAVAERYSGTYTPRGASAPLPRVSFWTLFNEPNFGEDLGPQATNGSTVATGPMMYRSIVDAGWSALAQTGHGRDTILIGETTARGMSGPPSRHAPEGFPGNYAQTKPLLFLYALYCVDSNFHQLRGRAASQIGCPTNAAGSRSFRRQHPGLFGASAYGTHPYPQNLPPDRDSSSDPYLVPFSQIPRLERTLDRLQSIYGSGTRFPIYNDEYGYITNPPARQRVSSGTGNYVSQDTAAFYTNWAEYLSWRAGRIRSFMQYPLEDPTVLSGNSSGGFASGLITSAGRFKPAYEAYRLPLFLPSTTTRRGRTLEVWGAVRPARFAQQDTGTAQVAQIQFQANSRGPFQTIRTVPVSGPGYFDVHIAFAGSGTVRLAWTYPATDPFFPLNAAGVTVYGRSQTITVH